MLYCALVRSFLKYSIVVWHPYLDKDQLRVEHVRKKFLSYAAYFLKIIGHPPHNYSLIFSRHITDLNFIRYSLLNSFCNIPDLLSVINFNFRISSYPTRNHKSFNVPPCQLPWSSILFTKCCVISIILTIVYNLVLMFSKLIFIFYLVYFLYLFCILYYYH